MATTNRGDLIVRPMGREDLERVLEIERASFPSPWSRAMFEAELGKNPFSWPVVAVEKATSRIVGYAVTWLMFEEVHILDLAVDTPYRRCGTGGMLVDLVLETARERGAARAILEVRESNEAARRLYERAGFSVESVRKGYYEHPRDNAIILVKGLGDAPEAGWEDKGGCSSRS